MEKLNDIISRQETINLVTDAEDIMSFTTIGILRSRIRKLPSAQPDNQINLCDSCDYLYPDCPAKYDDVIFGNGIGNDNVCACNKYKPSAQSQIIRCKDCKHRDKYGCCKYWKGLAMVDIPIATDDNDFCSYAEQT